MGANCRNGYFEKKKSQKCDTVVVVVMQQMHNFTKILTSGTKEIKGILVKTQIGKQHEQM